MDWSLKEIADELATRLRVGPMHFRLFIQPAVAIGVGIIDGKRDAKAGLPPFILGLVFGTGSRIARLKSVLWRLRGPIVIAILLDCVVQLMMFGHVRPLIALTFATSLMTVPYSTARALANRIHSSLQARRMKVALHDETARGRL